MTQVEHVSFKTAQKAELNRLAGKIQHKLRRKVTVTDLLNTWIEHGLKNGGLEKVCQTRLDQKGK